MRNLGIIHNAHAIRPTLHRKSFETNAATPTSKLFRKKPYCSLGAYHFLATISTRASFHVSL